MPRREDEESRTDLELYVHFETSTQYKVSEGGVEADCVWLPKSRVVKGDPIRRGSEIYEFSVPDWIARDRGLI